MRRTVGVVVALAALVTGALAAGGAGAGAAGPAPRDVEATSGHGEFIVDCPLASTSAYRADPILDRGQQSAHKHIFFGNIDITTLASQGKWAQMTWAHMKPPAAGGTSCADLSDGTAMWVPELFYDGTKRTQNAEGESIYVRAYYVTTGAAIDLPQMLEMVNGYPTATSPPVIDSASAATAYMQNIYWDCGESAGQTVVSPKSPWPYSCSAWYAWYKANNPTSFAGDGVVAHVNFPTCLLDNTPDNPDGGPFYAPAAVMSPMTNNLAFTPCPSGSQVIPQVTVRLHTLVDAPGVATPEPLVAPGSTWAGLPSCYSTLLETAEPCENDPPQASDLLLGFASDNDPTGTTCGPPVGQYCGWYSYHGDYMEMWQRVALSELDTGPNGTDPAGADPLVNGSYAPTLEDAEEDCLFGTDAHVCGFIPTHSNLNGS